MAGWRWRGGVGCVGCVGRRGRASDGGEFGVEGVGVEVVGLGMLREPAVCSSGGGEGVCWFSASESGGAVAGGEGVDDGVGVCEDAAFEFENARRLGGGRVEFGGGDDSRG